MEKYCDPDNEGRLYNIAHFILI
ncbi:hypothetical protein KL86PLE_100445 [uncultured Pleomorphomonas sp.]|uniref:Uncharacterized protein n=1 Tax=uncultured Pleomorphomonas sp. TaxID=442121 RepID=A0A212L3C3_9HYPH|nr:hypothetical protein KL86PLE_100445 [uncultured Pleomorphomonas sp.]